ncbi:MAG: hypothetical protein NT067_04835 [Candidatus Diapherotrites archaeon]|nr:hypothetical protein [Candidatus Diapherotrites archaeon]
MAKNVTQAMIDAIIEECIAQAKRGGHFNPSKAHEISGIIIRTLATRFGVKSDMVKAATSLFPNSYHFGSTVPANLLLDFSNLGLVSKPSHRNFVTNAIPAFKMERSLEMLKSVYGHLWKKETNIGYEDLPWDRKVKAMRDIFGANFVELEKLYWQLFELRELRKMQPEGSKKETLAKQIQENIKKQKALSAKIVTEIKPSLERKRPGADLRPRLLAEMKNEQGYLSNKDLDLLWRSLEEFEHPRPKKPAAGPKPMQPSRSAMRRSQQRRTLKKWQLQGRKPR